MKAWTQPTATTAYYCMFLLYLNLWSPVWEFRKFYFLTYHCMLPWLGPLSELNCSRWRKNPELVSSQLSLQSSFPPLSFHSLPVSLFQSADPSAWMKMTSSSEFKGTPHKAITNKPDVPLPPFPLCREGTEWGQVPFSKNEFSNFG